MLYLCTGTPGAGKTLNTIKYVTETSTFHNRDIYYFGIKQLDSSLGWLELDEEAALKWYKLPAGSVIIFDEAYNIFPVGHSSKEPPQHIRELATHRHHGFDIFLITQKVVGQIHSFIRGLVGTHFHFARIFNSKTINRFEWTACQENPNSASVRQNANVKTMRFDKKYYDLYHSADAHTHRMSLPWNRIIIILVAVGLMAFMANKLYSRFFGSERTFAAGGTGTIPQQQSPASNGQQVTVKMSYAQAHTPTVPGMPWTAPAYAHLMVARTWPRPAACYIDIEAHLSPCRCYSQQGTPLQVDHAICVDIVKHGFFDFTRDEAKERLTTASLQQGQAEPTQREAAEVQPNQSRAILIEYDPPTRNIESRPNPSFFN